MPVRVRVNGVSGARRTEWNVQVASNRLMTPLLAFSSLANALSASAVRRRPT